MKKNVTPGGAEQLYRFVAANWITPAVERSASRSVTLRK